jgi:hypothetical protein
VCAPGVEFNGEFGFWLRIFDMHTYACMHTHTHVPYAAIAVCAPGVELEFNGEIGY